MTVPDMREEFEVWLRDTHLGYPACINKHADEYTDPHIRKRWEAWQASRAALLKDYVPMPRQCPSWLEDAYDNACATDERAADWLSLSAYEAMLKAQEEALQQAGIEVKP